jgi:hypothetical protein
MSGSTAILGALEEAQYSIGGQTFTDAVTAENLSYSLVALSKAWAGTPPSPTSSPVNPFDPPSGPPLVPFTPGDGGGYLPTEGHCYTTAQIELAMTYIAGLEQAVSGDDKTGELQKLQAQSSAWANTGSAMGQFANMQEAIFNTLQSGQASEISLDNSATNNSASAGQGLAELVGTTANVVTLIAV